MLASPANLAFWMGLCSAWRVPGMAAEMNRFREHAAQGTDQLAKFANDYNTEMIAKAGLSSQQHPDTRSRRDGSSSRVLDMTVCPADAAQVLAMPGVGGLHVMPLGKGARRLATQLFVRPDGLR